MSRRNNRGREKVLAAAYRLLKVRLRSKQEMRQRLAGRRFPSSLIDSVVEELEAKGLIDDREFALFWARSRLQKGWAEQKVKHQLRLKGVAEEIQEEVFRRLREEIKKEEVMKELFCRRWERLKGENAVRRRRRIFGFFLRRGFCYADIEKIWEENK